MSAKKIEQDVNGEVEFYHNRKEYGFINSEEHDEDFMFTDVNLSDNIDEGDAVVFDVMNNYGEDDERRAVNVRSS